MKCDNSKKEIQTHKTNLLQNLSQTKQLVPFLYFTIIKRAVSLKNNSFLCQKSRVKQNQVSKIGKTKP